MTKSNKIGLPIFVLFILLSAQKAQTNTCKEPIIDNRTGYWTKQDEEVLEGTKKRCGEIYPEEPCVIKFIKKDDQVYNVICGRKK